MSDPSPRSAPRSAPWYAGGLRFTCTRCGDCCRSHGEYEFVYLTPQDIAQLARHLGLSRGEFLHRHTDRTAEGFRILKWPERACSFLDPDKGCTVYPARPEQCRSWPFWPENLERGVWEKEIVPFCPGAGEGRLYSLGEIRRISRGRGETGD